MTQEYQCGLFPISGDPIHYGHLDIITQTSKITTRLIVWIATNDSKEKALLSINKRVENAKKLISLNQLKNVIVIGSDELLVDIYLREGCDVLFRGIRDESDKAYEDKYMTMHEFILPGIMNQVRYIQAKEEFKYISSSMIKGFVKRNLDVSRFTPIFIQQSLEERILKQYKIGITGEMGVGKSFVAAKVAEQISSTYNIPSYNINFDQIIRDLYREKTNGTKKMIGEMASILGNKILNNSKTINRKKLKEMIFGDSCTDEMRNKIHSITQPHVMRKYREILNGKHGVIIIEWAQIAEMNMEHFTNNNVIVIDSPKDKSTFHNKRHITKKHAQEVSKHQWNSTKKYTRIKQQAIIDNSGSVIYFENQVSDIETSIKKLTETVANIFTCSIGD